MERSRKDLPKAAIFDVYAPLVVKHFVGSVLMNAQKITNPDKMSRFLTLRNSKMPRLKTNNDMLSSGILTYFLWKISKLFKLRIPDKHTDS